MILTVTLNPCIDKSSRVEKMKPESKLRCAEVVNEPGGGGINVSKALQKLETSSVPQIKNYADSMQVDHRRWIFLTGRKDSLYNTARISYTIDDQNNNLKRIEDQFLHTQFWALVDRNGDVRKIYDGIKYQEVKDMIRDAKKLMKE